MYKKYKPSKEYLAYLDSLPKSFFVTVLENSYNAVSYTHLTLPTKA